MLGIIVEKEGSSDGGRGESVLSGVVCGEWRWLADLVER